LEDLRTALNSANVNQAKGTFDGPQQSYTIGANDQLLSGDTYRPIIIAIATAPSSCRRRGHGHRRSRERAASGLGQPAACRPDEHSTPTGANIIGVVDRIKKLLPQLQAGLPAPSTSRFSLTAPAPSALRSKTSSSN